MKISDTETGNDSSPATIMCPVCGGQVVVANVDKVNRCEYCGSPVLGPGQKYTCVNHPDRRAKGVCHVCGDLICEECLEKRVGDYGGKLLTIVNCRKPECVAESEWAPLLNEEYQRMVNFDWADHIDNIILRVTGLGGVLFMIFELFFVLSMLGVQYFTAWGLSGNIPHALFLGDYVIVLCILGNLLSAIIMQTALQVYVHDRQLGSGIMLLIFLIIEVVFLLFRGVVFNLRLFPDPRLLLFLTLSFSLATILVFIGSLMAIVVGYKKRRQMQEAARRLGLTADSG